MVQIEPTIGSSVRNLKFIKFSHRNNSYIFKRTVETMSIYPFFLKTVNNQGLHIFIYIIILYVSIYIAGKGLNSEHYVCVSAAIISYFIIMEPK